MRALLQRVSRADVTVDDESVGSIGAGLLVLLGVDQHDDKSSTERLLDKVLRYRIFADPQGKMNLSLTETQGGLLVVSQFTLSADTRKGLRPGFSTAATPEKGQYYYQYFVELARARHHEVATGQFGAHMQVSLVNDGPVTFLLETQGDAA